MSDTINNIENAKIYKKTCIKYGRDQFKLNKTLGELIEEFGDAYKEKWAMLAMVHPAFLCKERKLPNSSKNMSFDDILEILSPDKFCGNYVLYRERILTSIYPSNALSYDEWKEKNWECEEWMSFDEWDNLYNCISTFNILLNVVYYSRNIEPYCDYSHFRHARKKIEELEV